MLRITAILRKLPRGGGVSEEGESTMRGLSLNIHSVVILILSVLTATGISQTFPDTIEIPVTFYDFHSDGSCPDFNPIVDNDLVVKNMVQDELDADGLPVRGSKVFFSYYIENWFRSSENGEQTVTNKKPTYSRPGGGFQSEQTVSSNPYVNKQIEDTLKFWHIGNGTTIPNGTYEFKDTSFFLLENKGFGIEQTWNWNQTQQMNNHNYSFSMKLEREFIYKKGMSFRFSGDDDVWVFINNKLALDIGGIHMEVQDSFNLDDIADELGLELDKKYTLSFFFAERQATSSHIWITTNIISAPPDSLYIDVEPDSVIYVGDTLIAHSTIETDTGVININDLSGTLVWDFLDPLGVNHDTTFTANKDSAVFIPTDAYTTVKIWAVYTDSSDTSNIIALTDTVEIIVLPGPPDHLVLEDSPEMPTDSTLWDDNPLDTVYILGNETYNEDFYGILRDKYGNWIGPGQDMDWSSADDNIVTAIQGSNPQQGQGRAVRATSAQSASTTVEGECDTNGVTLSDDLVVIILSEIYDIVSAAYFETDSRPDGYIDLVKVVVDDSLELTEDMLDKLYQTVTLPAHRNFTYDKDDFILTDDGFGIKVSQDKSANPHTAVDNGDVINISLTEFTNVGAILPTDVDVDDSLAPVVYQGWFYPAFVKVDEDTLDVYFSEDVKKPAKSSPFLFCYDGNSDSTYDMELEFLKNVNDSVVRFLVHSKEEEYPENGDSLWIEDDGEIKDDNGLEQKKDTKPAPLYVKAYTYTVVEAYYMDKSGSGGIDFAWIKLDGQPRELPDKILFANPFNVDDTSLVYRDDLQWLNGDPATLTIEATMSDTFDYEHSTAFDTDKYGKIKSDNFAEAPFDIGDKVAPVIDKAIYSPGKIIDEENFERAHDTLIIVFSEETQAVSYPTPFKLFGYRNGVKEEYYFTLRMMNGNNTTYRFKVNSINGVDYPNDGDSIWIDTASGIADELDNPQKVNENRHVKLNVRPKPFFITITVLHPVDPDDNLLPDEIINLLSENNSNLITNGTMLIIDPMIDFSENEGTGEMKCKVKIFDAVGNLIAESNRLKEYDNPIIQSDIVPINGRRKIVVTWSCQNRNRRQVEGATYLALIEVTGPYGGIPIIRKVYITVKKK